MKRRIFAAFGYDRCCQRQTGRRIARHRLRKQITGWDFRKLFLHKLHIFCIGHNINVFHRDQSANTLYSFLQHGLAVIGSFPSISSTIAATSFA